MSSPREEAEAFVEAWRRDNGNPKGIIWGEDALLDRLTAVFAEREKYRLALESVTVGGSEFHRDPERCVAHIRERYDSAHRRWVDVGLKLKAAEADRDRLRGLVGELANAVRFAIENEGDHESRVYELLARADAATKGE